ncbi:hypothetical protein ACHQM5_010491 [Ranunculus cassubicifolius]
MDSSRKRRGPSNSFTNGKLVMSFYRAPSKPNPSFHYTTSKVKPSPPPSSVGYTSIGYLVDQEFSVPSSNKKVSFAKSEPSRDQEYMVASSNKKVSYMKAEGPRDTKGYLDYSSYGDELVDIKAASYISHVQERFRLERAASERRNNKDLKY